MREQHPSVNVIEKFEWKLTIGESYQIFFFEGRQPNRIHRWIQKVCLGFKWEKIN